MQSPPITTDLPLYLTRVLEARVEFVEQSLIKPLRLSSGTITRLTEARATVRVSAGRLTGSGSGSIYLSDLWAWPDATRSHEERDEVLRRYCLSVASNLPAWCEGEAHPLELGMRLHLRSAPHPTIPVLASAMCASPFDAAIHDAAGRALGLSSFHFYRQDCPAPSADAHFQGRSAIGSIRRMFRSEPVPQLPAWFVVSAADDLNNAADEWTRRGYSCCKIKVLGRDPPADAQRTVAVYRSLRSRGVARPRLSLDSNEANPDPGSVLEYLEALKRADADTFAALEYLEQPTARDITRHAFNWREVTALKPVLLDEGLTDLGLLPLAKKQGWSGLALKTCKGHSFALCAAAWAHENGMLLALQDLTNPGLAAIHACLFAAHVPTINGVELNSPQYTPHANRAWLPRLACLFEPRNGVHSLPDMNPPGLGATL